MRARSFSHAGITVSDFNKAVQFYWDVFGCPLVGVADTPSERVRAFFGVDHPQPSCKIGWIRVPGGGVLEIFEFRPHQPPRLVPWNGVGLTASETANTITSGFRAGMRQPRHIVLNEHEHDSNGITSTPDAPFGHIDEPDPSDVDEFWDTRELLAHIRTSARARMTSPWAVLACVLARVVTATPHGIVLPPIVGGVASLNTFVGLVGATQTRRTVGDHDDTAPRGRERQARNEGTTAIVARPAP